MDEGAEHLALGVQLDQRELDRLVGRQRLAERFAFLGVLDGPVDAELRRAETGRRLADAVLVEEVLGDLQAAALAAEDRAVGHAHVGEADVGVIGRHVEGPEELEDLEARRCRSVRGRR